MNIKNFEFKAKVDDVEKYELKLSQLNPVFIGVDRQTDTYFKVNFGRLKLREGNIENALIQYEREDTARSKLSDVVLYKHLPDPALKFILTTQFGIKGIVEKIRKIYFIENVKFHFDSVKNLGQFIEVEAIDHTGNSPAEKLKEQCEFYLRFFEISAHQLIDRSYSDFI